MRKVKELRENGDIMFRGLEIWYKRLKLILEDLNYA